MKAAWLRHLAIAGLLLGVAAFWARNQISPPPYYYDEADYVYAASRGWLANWSDTPALTLADFVRLGLSRGRDSGQRVGLSETLRDSGDMNGYRHWHGPLYFYGLIAARAPARTEPAARALMLVCPALAFATIYLGCLWLLPGIQGSLAAALAGLLFLWSPAIVKTTEIAPHILFSGLCLASLVFTAKMMDTGRRAYWYAALAWAGLAFCTMELTFALIPALLICGHLERARLRPDWPLVRNSLLALAAPVILFWPGGVYKLTFVKSYLAMAYLAVFRKAAWGDITFLGSWSARLSSMPVEWALILVSVALYFGYRHLPGRRVALPFLIFGVLMLLAVIRVNALGPRYVTPFVPPLLVFSGITLAGVISGWKARLPRWSALAAIVLLVFLDTGRQANRAVAADARAVDLLSTIRRHGWDGKALLIPHEDVPVLHYYFPGARLRGYLDAAAIPGDLARDRFDGVIYPGYPVRAEAISGYTK